jgi:hypothetical protein
MNDGGSGGGGGRNGGSGGGTGSILYYTNTNSSTATDRAGGPGGGRERDEGRTSDIKSNLFPPEKSTLYIRSKDFVLQILNFFSQKEETTIPYHYRNVRRLTFFPL